jgi:hypothetical protein
MYKDEVKSILKQKVRPIVEADEDFENSGQNQSED